jgi:hypothetical protein
MWWNTAARHPRGCGGVAKKHRQRNNQNAPTKQYTMKTTFINQQLLYHFILFISFYILEFAVLVLPWIFFVFANHLKMAAKRGRNM